MKLAATEPFDSASLLAFLAARVVPGVEEVVGDTYRRSLPYGSVADATVHTDGIETDNPALAEVFDLDAPAAEIADVLGRDPRLRVDTRPPGPGVPSTATSSRSVRFSASRSRSQAAATHAARLVAAAGDPVANPRGTVTHVFPTAEAIAAAPDSVFAMPVRRRETLRSLAGVPLNELIALPGIGPVDAGLRRDARAPPIATAWPPDRSWRAARARPDRARRRRGALAALPRLRRHAPVVAAQLGAGTTRMYGSGDSQPSG